MNTLNWTHAKKAIALAVFALCLTAPSQAQDIGRVASGGNGCASSAQGSLSRDGKTLKLVVGTYQAKVDGPRSFDRKTCNFTIPVDVPAGKRFAVIGATYNGENSLPKGAESVLRVEYFFPGTTGDAFEQTFDGPLRRSFALASNVSRAWSTCGADTNLRVNSSLRVSSPGGQRASISLSGRRAGAIIVKLEWRDC